MSTPRDPVLVPDAAYGIDLEAEVIVVCAGDPEIEKLLAGMSGKKVIDLVGLRQIKHSGYGYAGIAW